MLRCNNVRALWTAAAAAAGGGGKRMVLMSGSSAGGQRGLRVGYALPISLRGSGRGILGLRGIVPAGANMSARWYSTGEGSVEREGDGIREEESGEVDSSNLTAEMTATPDSVSDDQDNTGTTQPNPEQSEGDSILQIAMAGTSPKIREHDPSSIHGKLSSKAIKSELKWLQDPKALADRVARLLKVDDLASAAGLVRQAQKEKMNCQVAWNHLLDYTMTEGYPMAAFRLYNEMKKRGRKPSSITYTIMLKGLSRAPKDCGLNPVKTALTIYNSISARNSTVERSVIHSNALLEVCSRQGNMDTLWQVAGDMPEQGPGAPDPLTYTVILRAILITSQKAVRGIDSNDFAKIQQRKAQAIKEGKRLWPDILYQWKNGHLALDNIVVQTMATLLLEGGTDQNCYEVLSLYNQTHGLPILAKKPPAAADVVAEESGEVEDVPFVDENGLPLRKPKKNPDPEEVEEEENLDHVFDPIPGSNGPSYLEAGNRELSTILDTCMIMTQGLGVGKAYWDHLILGDNQYKVEPDAVTCHQYLRLLRLSRSSRTALEVIRNQMVPNHLVEGKTFHIAFSVFRRDRRNINILKIANELLALMDQSLLLPAPRDLEGYFELISILSENPQHLLYLNGLNMDEGQTSRNLASVGSKLQRSLKIAAARNLRPIIMKLHEAVESGAVSNTSPKGTRVAALIRDHGISGKKVVGILARTRLLLDEITKQSRPSSIPKEEWQQFKKDGRILSQYSYAGLQKKHQKTVVVPTNEQITAFREKGGRV